MGKKLTTEKFIEKAKLIHNYKYNYSKCVYESFKEKVTITCPIHGDFEQTTDNHLHGSGCPKCGIKRAFESQVLSKENFLKRCNKVHQNKYDYSKFKYTNYHTKSIIICPIHGEFEQSPGSHLSGQGCRECSKKSIGDSNRSNIQEFIRKSLIIHENNYNYNNVNYKKADTKVTIHCNTCGLDFEQTPNSHLNGQGCPKCGYDKTSKYHKENPTGWSYDNWEKAALRSRNFDSYKVYIIECYNDNERFIKIGRTFCTIEKRFKNSIPYLYKIIREFEFDFAKECCEYEQKLKNKYKEYKYIPLIKFGGMHECFLLTLKNIKYESIFGV